MPIEEEEHASRLANSLLILYDHVKDHEIALQKVNKRFSLAATWRRISVNRHARSCVKVPMIHLLTSRPIIQELVYSSLEISLLLTRRLVRLSRRCPLQTRHCPDS